MTRTWRQEEKQKRCKKRLLSALLSRLTRYPSYTFQGHLPGDGTAHNELGPPTSINKMPAQTCLQVSLMEAFFFKEPPFSPHTDYACFNLTKSSRRNIHTGKHLQVHTSADCTLRCFQYSKNIDEFVSL